METKTPIRGRGAHTQPGSRFDPWHYGATEEIEPPIDPAPRTQFLRDSSKSVLTTNTSPDIGFEQSINPYRGCEHGCAYCYARPTHEYLGYSAGIDFETKILLKEDGPALLRKALAMRNYSPKLIVMSGVTDCYQPIERTRKITRGLLEVLVEFRNPVTIITKNALVTRDIDLLSELASYQAASVVLSVTTLDNDLCGKLEPRTSRPQARLAAIRVLKDAKIPVGVNVAPIIPGLTDHETPNILKQARNAGADFAGFTLLRLPYGVKEIFSDWLEAHYPDRKQKVLARVRDLRGGKLNESEFGSRMRGHGVFAATIKNQFVLWEKKLGYSEWPALSTEHFIRPAQPGEQQTLF